MDKGLPVAADVTWERREHKTPHGGTYSVAQYRDIAHKPVAKSRAVFVEICEFDADGTPIFRTYLQTKSEGFSYSDAGA